MTVLTLNKNIFLIGIRYILAFIFLFHVIKPFSQKVIFDNKNYEYNSIANYTDWNEYWYSGRNGFVHFHNGKKNFYLNNSRNSGIEGEWVQSNLFKDQFGFLHTTNFEYYLRYNNHTNRFESKKIKIYGKVIESDYQISEIDTFSNTLLMRAGEHLVKYNYLADSVKEYIFKSKNLFQIINFSDSIIVNVPHKKKKGIDIIKRDRNHWISKDILKGFNFLKGIASHDKLLLLSNKGVYNLGIDDLKLKKCISFRKEDTPIDFLLFQQGLIILFKGDKLAYYDKMTDGRYQFVENNFDNLIKLNEVYQIQNYDDQLILSSKNSGLQFIDKDLFTICDKITSENDKINDLSFTLNTINISSHKISLPSHIHSASKEDNLVYISTENGLFIYNIGLSKLSSEQFPIKDKIIHYVLFVENIIYYLTTDGNIYQNQKWLGNIGIVNNCYKRNSTYLLSTYNGLLKVSSNGLENVLEGRKALRSIFGNGFEIWSLTEDGIIKINEDCSQIKYCNSSIYPESISKIEYDENCMQLILYRPDSKYEINEAYLDKQIYKPLLNVCNIYLDGKEIKKSKLNEIPFSFGRLAFSYIVNEKHCNDGYNCFYRIDEIGHEWIKATNDFIELSRLPFGDYTIRIMVIGSNNITGDEIKINFNVIPPLYRQWWFLFFIGLMLFTIGYIIRNRVLLNKLRLKQLELDKLKALQDQRDQLSQDLHDEIGSGLSKIKFLSHHFSNSDDKEVKDNINSLSSSMIDSMRDMLWSLDVENDNFASLASRLRTLCRNYFTHSNTHSTFEHYGDENTIINGLIRRNIILITKESFNNVLKHANATLVTTTIICDDAFITLTIQDNGNGFVNSLQHVQKAYGITGMKKRVDELNGKVAIDGKSGCKITISYPLLLK